MWSESFYFEDKGGWVPVFWRVNHCSQDGVAPVYPTLMLCFLRNARLVKPLVHKVLAEWNSGGEVAMSTDELSASDSEAMFAGAGERWAPVGAVASPEEESGSGCAGQPKQRGSSSATEQEMATQLRRLEEEQDQLNSSLLALTSHFAQVQFRLKQIVHAQSDEKERMLAELRSSPSGACPHVWAAERRKPSSWRTRWGPPARNTAATVNSHTEGKNTLWSNM